MMIEKAYYDEDGKLLFQFRLITAHKNRWYSSIPPPLILKYFPIEIFHLKNALICKETQANRLLEPFARKIISKPELKPYFYPDYLLNEPDSDDLDSLIWLQYKFVFEPNMLFSRKLCPIQFYYIEQIFNMNKALILRDGTKLEHDVLERKYLKDAFVEQAFNDIANESVYYLEMHDESFAYVLILCELDLLMLISI